jgi:rRNA biogenesis protein RRP5
VKAVIIGIDKARISLSLKPSLFNEEDFEEGAHTNEPIPELSGVAKNDNVETSDDNANEEVDISDSKGEGDDVMDVDIDQALVHSRVVSAQKPPVVSKTPIPSLALSGGFQWSFGEQQLGDDCYVESPSSESDLEGDEYGKRKTKRRRKAIEHDLTADMHTKAPESNADFERLLLGSPNSSYLWIQYMSFQLQLSEVEKSREIGRRAIKTINFREEQEKLNVWIALLNLENVYGTLESLETTFKQAARANDSKTIHLRLASIFDQSDKLEVSKVYT